MSEAALPGFEVKVRGASSLTRAPEQSHVFPGGPPLTRNYRRFRAACHLGAPGAGR